MNCRLRLYWHDSRLIWDKAIYNLNKTRVTTDPSLPYSIWVPDLQFYENKNPNFYQSMSRNLAHVSSDGNIYLALNGLLILDINSTDYNGFKNIANLSITIGSHSYPQSSVDLIPFEPWVNTDE